MTTTFIWHDLKQLVMIDYQINRLRALHLKEQAALSAAKSNLHNKKTAALETEAALRALHKEIDRHELSSKDLRSQINRKKNQLGNLTNNKERIALEHELAKLTSQFDDNDTQTMRVMEQHEIITTNYAAQKKIILEAEAELKTLEDQTMEHYVAHEQAIKALEAEWTAICDLVPAQLRNDYLQLKKRVSNPAAPIVADSCSACFMNLLHTESTSLSTRSVIKCRGCFRFLYLPDATTEQLSS